MSAPGAPPLPLQRTLHATQSHQAVLSQTPIPATSGSSTHLATLIATTDACRPRGQPGCAQRGTIRHVQICVRSIRYLAICEELSAIEGRCARYASSWLSFCCRSITSSPRSRPSAPPASLWKRSRNALNTTVASSTSGSVSLSRTGSGV
jgi:hypothetical protein